MLTYIECNVKAVNICKFSVVMLNIQKSSNQEYDIVINMHSNGAFLYLAFTYKMGKTIVKM